MRAPVALFTYNRLKHTQATIQALLQNPGASETDLWIFSDGSPNQSAEAKVADVRKYLHSIRGFKSVNIIQRDSNFGLGNNIISGVTDVINIYGKIIVLEDDLITSPFFLQYMNDALHVYEQNTKVISIHGYIYPVKEPLDETFFLKGADCLGWGTWNNRWAQFEKNGQVLLSSLISTNTTKEFDYNGAYPYTRMLQDQINGRNSSWAVRWYAFAFINDMYTLYPCKSLILHAGGDSTGTNAGFDELLDVTLSDRPVQVSVKTVEQNVKAYSAFQKILRKLNDPPIIYKIKRKIIKLFR